MKKQKGELAIAYTAGIIDGEGWIGITNHKHKGYRSMRLQVVVGNTEPGLIHWLFMQYGGYTRCDQKPYPRKDCYKWELSAIPALNFLKLILPYLTIKRPQAELGIEFGMGRYREVGNRKHFTDEQRAVHDVQKLLMNRLNRKGKEITSS